MKQILIVGCGLPREALTRLFSITAIWSPAPTVVEHSDDPVRGERLGPSIPHTATVARIDERALRGGVSAHPL
jgi:hypothetical protein